MKLPIAAKLGIGVAVTCALLCLGGALWGPVFAIPQVVIFLSAAWLLWHGKAWGGYGPALFVVILLSGAALRSPAYGPALAMVAAIAAVVGGLLFYAGRSLSQPGSKMPWIALAAITGLFQILFQPFVVPTGAMEDTILSGDHVLVNRLARNPERGAIVVHRYPVDPKQTFVKRIVGMPGDRLHFENKRLFVNGQALGEAYAIHKTEYVDNYRDNFPRGEVSFTPIAYGQRMLAANVENSELVVPAGKYFVLGDNRDSSLDSRYWGFVERADILGKPVIVYYSVDNNAITPENKDEPTITRARWSRMFKLL